MNTPVFTVSGQKAALIATLINVIATFLTGHSYNLNLFLPGLYLGLSKEVGPKTASTFFIANLIFIFLDDGFIKNSLADYINPSTGFVVIALSSAMLAAVPLGIMWLVRKFRHAS